MPLFSGDKRVNGSISRNVVSDKVEPKGNRRVETISLCPLRHFGSSIEHGGGKMKMIPQISMERDSLIEYFSNYQNCCGV